MIQVHDLSRHWWLLALRGLAAIIFGILAFAMPGITLAVLVILFGAYALVDGVNKLARVEKGTVDDWPWNLSDALETPPGDAGVQASKR